ncbi:MAG: CoA-binding protein [Bacteroidota bacterium]
MNTCEILNNSKTIAVVGISKNPSRISRMVTDYLINNGYKIVGVNPGKPKINDIDIYANLKEIPFKIDIVNVFRKSEDIPLLIPDVLEVNPKVLWLQLGIRNDDAVIPVVEKGITTIQDRCIKIEHGMCF